MTAPLPHACVGHTRDGQPVTRFVLGDPAGFAIAVLDYGAIVNAIHLPTPDGGRVDVVLGYDAVERYEDDPFYMGAVIGRCAGRIAGASFVLEGTRVALARNDGARHLHGGPGGFGKVRWQWSRDESDGTSLVLRHRSPDGEAGYPGILDVRVTYSLPAGGVLAVEYEATTDRPTPVNLTQHAYFDLAGEGSGMATDQLLQLEADRYAPITRDLVPQGSLLPVDGTPFDFRQPVALGAALRAADPQLALTGGYDHSFTVRRAGPGLVPAARLAEPRSGRSLTVWTTEPAVHLYTGNFLDGRRTGKHGHRYERNGGVCLETQHYADSPNQPGFPSTILRPGERLHSCTEYRFGTSHGESSMPGISPSGTTR